MKEKSGLESSVKTECTKRTALKLLPGYHLYCTMQMDRAGDPSHKDIHYLKSTLIDSAKLSVYLGILYKIFS